MKNKYFRSLAIIAITLLLCLFCFNSCYEECPSGGGCTTSMNSSCGKSDCSVTKAKNSGDDRAATCNCN